MNSNIRKILRESINRVLNEDAHTMDIPTERHFDSKLKNKLIRFMFKTVDKTGISSKLYRDDAWQNVTAAKKILLNAFRYFADANGIDASSVDIDCYCENGGYKQADPTDNMPTMKQYLLDFYIGDSIIISGHMNCHAAGTMEDRFSAYDMTFGFY